MCSTGRSKSVHRTATRTTVLVHQKSTHTRTTKQYILCPLYVQDILELQVFIGGMQVVITIQRLIDYSITTVPNIIIIAVTRTRCYTCIFYAIKIKKTQKYKH